MENKVGDDFVSILRALFRYGPAVVLTLLASCSPVPEANIQIALQQYEQARSLEAAAGDIIDITGFGGDQDLLVTPSGTLASPLGAQAVFEPNINGDASLYRLGSIYDENYTAKVADSDGDGMPEIELTRHAALQKPTPIPKPNTPTPFPATPSAMMQRNYNSLAAVTHRCTSPGAHPGSRGFMTSGTSGNVFRRG